MDEMFRGYVRTKNKQCIEKFKDREGFMTREDAETYDEFAGILARDVILVDIDDFDQSEILMKIVEDNNIVCRVYKTTRGKHFFFKNNCIESCGTHVQLACGLTADIKVGSSNSYSILKFAGVDRPILYDKFDDEAYGELPAFLRPIKSRTNFFALGEGDGRNQTLFNYILTLQSSGFTKDEARDCLQIINHYILKDSLSESELNTLSRDEAFQKPVFFKDKTFLHDRFAEYLKSEYNIVRLNGRLHIYKDGIYVEGSQIIEAAMIKHIPSLTAARRMEVLKYLDLLVLEESEVAEAWYIAFKNGILNIRTGELQPFSPDIVITNKIDFNYNPDAYHELMDKTLNKLACQDPEIRSLLEEAVGYCFFRRNELRKSFILLGGKRNGKSTFLDLLKHLLGKHNLSALDLNELGDRFSTASLFGKLANIGDDIGDEFITNTQKFKKIASGNEMKGEKKGVDEFFFEPYCKLVFSANTLPRIKDRTGAVLDRLVIIPFNAQFLTTDPDYNPYIKDDLMTREAMEYLLMLGVEGLKRVLSKNAFTESSKVNAELAEYERNNNPVLMFFSEVEVDELTNEPTKNVYARYSTYCRDNGYQPMSNIEFTKAVKSHLGLTTVRKRIGGAQYRVFVDANETNEEE